MPRPVGTLGREHPRGPAIGRGSTLVCGGRGEGRVGVGGIPQAQRSARWWDSGLLQVFLDLKRRPSLFRLPRTQPLPPPPTSPLPYPPGVVCLVFRGWGPDTPGWLLQPPPTHTPTTHTPLALPSCLPVGKTSPAIVRHERIHPCPPLSQPASPHTPRGHAALVPFRPSPPSRPPPLSR